MQAEYIYTFVKKYIPKLYLYKEDALQEIRLALLIAPAGSEFKVASKACFELMKQLGFSRSLGKNGGLNTNITYTETPHEIDVIIEFYKIHTYKETCVEFNINPCRRVQYLLHKIYKKK